jgi:NAD(P)-dependent dehydrogenase (short-subunit alcohol dehydrogenase family)
VNNAAYQMVQEGGIEDLTTDQFDRVMKTNLYAMFWLSKFAVPHLKPGSTIINTTSIQVLHSYNYNELCMTSCTMYIGVLCRSTQQDKCRHTTDVWFRCDARNSLSKIYESTVGMKEVLLSKHCSAYHLLYTARRTLYTMAVAIVKSGI